MPQPLYEKKSNNPEGNYLAGTIPYLILRNNLSVEKFHFRGETTHHPPIPDETQDAIFQLAANVYEVMEARYEMDYQRYYDTLKNIPEIFRDSYHILISLLAQFIVTFFDGRRGAEGIELLTKSHWKLQEENGKRILKKVHTLIRYKFFGYFITHGTIPFISVF